MAEHLKTWKPWSPAMTKNEIEAARKVSDLGAVAIPETAGEVTLVRGILRWRYSCRRVCKCGADNLA